MSQKHYFIPNPELAQRERSLPFTYAGQSFRFATAAGLFSCDEIDGASVFLLETLCKQVPPLQGKLLDLGCGYGLLGIVLAKTHTQNTQLTLADINPIACDFARKNAKTHQVTATVIPSDGFENIPDTFDHIVLNPPIHAGKETTYRLYRESAAHLNPNGSLYIVIHKKHGAESTLEYLNGIFTETETLNKRKGIFVFRGTLRK